VSLNRYERKKDIGLAIKAYAQFINNTNRNDCLMVVAGGYDDRLSENVEHHLELVALGHKVGMSEQLVFL
jgi:alpha-1,3/alpha-1,6-mannosyltransferase